MDSLEDYIMETVEERISRVEYENDELTKQINDIESRYSRILAENGRLRAEQEELASRLHAAQESTVDSRDIEEQLELALANLEDVSGMVCAYSDDCDDFDRYSGRRKVYLADD
jgi:regulator of replication initiation timing